MTLLEALRDQTEAEVVSALEAGTLPLTGNFRGLEAEVASGWRRLEALEGEAN